MSGTLRIVFAAVGDDVAPSVAVTVRDGRLRHVRTQLGVDPVEVPPGLYQVSAVLPTGATVQDLVQVRDGGETVAVLGAPPPKRVPPWSPVPAAVPRGVESLDRLGRVVIPSVSPERPPELVDGHGRALDGAVVRMPGRLGVRWSVTLAASPQAVPFLRYVDGGAEVRVALPLDGGRRTVCEVQRAAGAPAHAVEVVVHGDPGFVALASYVERQAVFTAGALAARHAQDALADKVSDPVRAVLGAYVLVRLGTTGPVRPWFANLANWFPWLPDGLVLHARLLDDEGERDAARLAWIEAAGRGLPLCTDGLSMLLAGLRARLRAGPDDAVQEALDGLLADGDRFVWDRLFTTRVSDPTP